MSIFRLKSCYTSDQAIIGLESLIIGVIKVLKFIYALDIITWMEWIKEISLTNETFYIFKLKFW